ncbi:peptide MFS transporter [Pseudoalteromonas rubra]|uniref:MFS transporter n=1 Tax=Pseudoalteromonas rubra TaxID=43658 RepID=A0A0U3HP56_9GAMM|nr:peptide MFS transporter [Pseudoalteromonas rubra]ALU44709.1 hypothetical protein AT705_18225 [Pseudoalteromonas rubra]
MSSNTQAPTILGHPKGLWMLFSAEFWERFCYYGMRAVLAPYVAIAFFDHLTAEEAAKQASLTYGGYTSMVYMTAILGGYVADRLIGYQRSIILGGIMMAVGMFMLMAPDLTTFLFGLAFIVMGNGLFKPNISTIVGKLYEPGDPRRDSGFTIFYMGINLGGALAPIICATIIGAIWGYQYGFLAAGIGMIFGVMVFQLQKSWLGGVGKAENAKASWSRFAVVAASAVLLVVPAFYLLSNSALLGYLLAFLMLGLIAYFLYSGFQSGDKKQLHRYIAMLLLFLANTVFWALFEQAGSSLNFFAKDHVNLDIGFTTIHFTLFQSANSIFIILFAPVLAALWLKLDQREANPSIPRKFAFGLLGAALGFYVLVFAIQFMQDASGKVPAYMLALCYLIHTLGELCLSPIGLSMVTKLAKPKEVGLAMGGWFLSIAMAQYLAGVIASIATSGGGESGHAVGSIAQYSDVFMQLVWLGVGGAVIYFLAAPAITRLMHGVR